MKNLKNLKVGTRILAGYIVALLQMAMIGLLALVRISQIGDVVTNLADNLARDQHLADAISGESLAVRYFALRHINQTTPKNLETYAMQAGYLDHLLDQSSQQLTQPTRVQMLGELDDSFHDDDAAFTEVSDLLETRQNLVARDVDFLEVRTQSN